MAASPQGPNVELLKGVPVLVIEDVWHVAKSMKSMLEELMQVVGPPATTARSLAAAQRPKLAIVDVNLKNESACCLID
jgi:hypothetical protein